jgi:molybdopterin/thiamine biosynthesis adenylyltransferase
MSTDFPSSKYDRQERLLIWNQKIIEKSTILVVGVGGTGSEVCKNLALMGIGHLILVDSDTIEFSNLNRQMLFREEDIGKLKSEITKLRLKELFNPNIIIDSYSTLIQDLPQKILEKADIIAGCVDNFLARQYLNSIAIELNKPFVDSATDGYFGQIRYIKKGKTACLACDNPLPPDETRTLTAPCTLVGKPRIREHCAWKALYDFNELHNREPSDTSKKDVLELTKLANQHAEKNNFAQFEKKELLQLILFHVPSLITVNAVISGIQSQEIIKGLFLENKSAFLKKERQSLNKLMKGHRFRIPSYLIYSALTGTVNTFSLTPDPKCMVCKKSKSSSKRLVKLKVEKQAPFGIILDKFRSKKQKEFVAFRGNIVLPEEEIIEKLLTDGDRITLSSLDDTEEIRVKIEFIR